MSEQPVTVRWRRLSSRSGDLPVPPGSDQQTSCLVLDADKDGRNEFILACRNRGPAIVWYRPALRGWMVYVIEAEAISIEAGGAFYDIDGDGDLDIVAKPYNWDTPRIDLWINEGGG